MNGDRPARLARWCARRRRLTFQAWVAVVVGVQLAAGAANGSFANHFSLPGSESQRAEDVLAARFPEEAGDPAVVVFRSEPSARDPTVQLRMERLFDDIAAVPHVTAVASPYTGGAAAISSDRRTAFGTVRFDRPAMDLPREVARRIVALAEDANRPGLQVEVGGHAIRQAEEARDLREGVGLVAAMVILVVTFGSVVAAGLPVVVGLFALSLGLGLIGLLAPVIDVPEVTEQLSLMIGLGVGIDYALLVVTRFRQELRGGHSVADAIGVAAATAGRAVVLAGSAVVVSLLGMFLMGLPFVRGMALGAAIVVVLTMAASLTLLPAALGLAGAGVDRLRIPGLNRPEVSTHRSGWFRWSRVVQRRPGWAAGAALLVMVTIALPALAMRLGVADEGRDSSSLTTRHAYDLLSQGFGPGFNGPLILVVELRADVAADKALVGLADRVADTDGVALALPPKQNRDGDTAVVTVRPRAKPPSSWWTASETT